MGGKRRKLATLVNKNNNNLMIFRISYPNVFVERPFCRFVFDVFVGKVDHYYRTDSGAFGGRSNGESRLGTMRGSEDDLQARVGFMKNRSSEVRRAKIINFHLMIKNNSRFDKKQQQQMFPFAINDDDDASITDKAKRVVVIRDG